jgi:threonine dehydratase
LVFFWSDTAILAGTALANYYFGENSKVIAAEPKNADDAFHSFQAGYIIPSENPDTIADGLLTSLGERNFPIIQEYVDQIFTVNEQSIRKAMRLIWERMKIIIEPSSAVSLAVIMENRSFFEGKRIGVIISGGNVDLEQINAILF